MFPNKKTPVVVAPASAAAPKIDIPFVSRAPAPATVPVVTAVPIVESPESTDYTSFTFIGRALLVLAILAFLVINLSSSIDAMADDISRWIRELIKKGEAAIKGADIKAPPNEDDVHKQQQHDADDNTAAAATANIQQQTPKQVKALQRMTAGNMGNDIRGGGGERNVTTRNKRMDPLVERIDETTALEEVLSKAEQRASAPPPAPNDANYGTKPRKHGGGFCYVGEDRGVRSCIEVKDYDKCMSGQIFPSQQICVHPTLRQ